MQNRFSLTTDFECSWTKVVKELRSMNKFTDNPCEKLNLATMIHARINEPVVKLINENAHEPGFIKCLFSLFCEFSSANLLCKFLIVMNAKAVVQCPLYADALMGITINRFSIDVHCAESLLYANKIRKRKKSTQQVSRTAICMSLSTRKNKTSQYVFSRTLFI